MNLSNKENIAYKRLAALFDDGSFTELDANAKSVDGEVEVVSGFGYVNSAECYAFAQNSEINSGAVSVAHCAKISKVYSLATKTGCPVIGIYDSNGVKLTEGFEVLNAYGELLKASTKVSGVIPQISVIAGSCLGTSALMANMADAVIAVKDSDFYVTAPSDITAEKSANDGTVDILADNFDEAVNEARKLAVLLPSNNLESAPFVSFDFTVPSVLPTVASSVDDVVNSFLDGDIKVEFKKNYAANVSTVLSTIEGKTVGVIAFNGNKLCAKCAYKAEAFVKLCDAFNIPMITVADSNGIEKGIESQALVALTKLSSAYASATCPKISLITSEAVGASYIVLAGKGANADFTLAWDNAVASPLEVDAAVAFLYNDRLAKGENRATLEKEYKDTIGSVYSAAACGAVDDVFEPEKTREKLIEYLNVIAGKRETTIPRKHSVK